MNNKKFCILLLIYIGLFLSVKAQLPPLTIANFENVKAIDNLVITDTVLVFQSGFEGTTQVVPYGNTTDDNITGSDPSRPKSDWDALRKNDIGIVHFNYTGGDTSKRYAKVINDPTRQGNKVLHFWLNDYWLASENQEKARIQLEFHNIKGGFKEFYQTVRMYLTDDFNILKTWDKGFSWLTISEFWNNEWWVSGEKYGFRISIGIAKEPGAGKDLYFGVDSQDMGFVEVWNAGNKNVKVPVGEWFTMEYYFKEGNDKNGRFYMTITPDGGEKQTVCDVRNFTHNTGDPHPNGITAYNPVKLYTSKELVDFMKGKGKTLQIYWDDLKLWKVQK